MSCGSEKIARWTWCPCTVQGQEQLPTAKWNANHSPIRRLKNQNVKTISFDQACTTCDPLNLRPSRELRKALIGCSGLSKPEALLFLLSMIRTPLCRNWCATKVTCSSQSSSKALSYRNMEERLKETHHRRRQPFKQNWNRWLHLCHSRTEHSRTSHYVQLLKWNDKQTQPLLDHIFASLAISRSWQGLKTQNPQRPFNWLEEVGSKRREDSDLPFGSLFFFEQRIEFSRKKIEMPGNLKL